MTNLPEALEKLADELRAAGFEGTEVRRPDAFGDGLLVFERSSARFRFVSDRGQWWVEASAAGWKDDWFDADVWKACLGAADVALEPNSLEVQADWLQGNLAAVTAAMQASDEPLVACLRSQQSARARARLGLSE